MKSFIVINNDEIEEKVLLEICDDEVRYVFAGDYYHDKIGKKIEGFEKAMTHFDIEYEVVKTIDFNHFDTMSCADYSIDEDGDLQIEMDDTLTTFEL